MAVIERRWYAAVIRGRTQGRRPWAWGDAEALKSRQLLALR